MDDFSVGSQLRVHENTLSVVSRDLWLLSGVPDALTRPVTAGLSFGGCGSLCGATVVCKWSANFPLGGVVLSNVCAS